MKQILKRLFWHIPCNYILMFHHVASEPTIKCSSCVLDSDRFNRLIEDIRNSCVSLEQLEKSKYRKKFAITFDDGLEDTYSIAYPILKKYNIPFTIFVVTDFLNLPGYLTKPQLLEMCENPLVTVGAHGVSHEILSEMSYAQQKREIEESKRMLEKLIGKEVKYFAYSHGQYNADTLKLVKVYDNAFSVKGLPYNFITRNCKWQLPRINITDSTIEEKVASFDL